MQCIILVRDQKKRLGTLHKCDEGQKLAYLLQLYLLSLSKISAAVNCPRASSKVPISPSISTVRSIILSYLSDFPRHLKHFICNLQPPKKKSIYRKNNQFHLSKSGKDEPLVDCQIENNLRS